MSLLMAAQVDSEGEQVELRGLQTQLETTQTLVALLSQQLSELKEQVCLFIYLFYQEFLNESEALNLLFGHRLHFAKIKYNSISITYFSYNCEQK